MNPQYLTVHENGATPVINRFPDECVDLVYLDPPFNSKANYNQTFGKGNGVPAQVTAFNDTWTWKGDAPERYKEITKGTAHPAHDAISGLGRTLRHQGGMLAYLVYMGNRLPELKRVLRPTGSIYLHCDPTASHYLKVLMDGVFGAQNFRNEIVWKKYGGVKSAVKTKFATETDSLLCYVKGEKWTFNKIYRPLAESTIKGEYKHIDENGRRYAVPRGRKFRKGVIKRVYLDENPGVAIGSLWADKGLTMQGRDGERLGYDTQKPLALLERIVRASSNEGDLVLDPFCGSGTTLEAARNLGRKWIGIDVSPRAIKLIRDTRFQGAALPIYGLPSDMEGARLLKESNPFHFESWIIQEIPGLAPNQKQVADGGIDGRGRFHADIEGEEGVVIAQVKSGGYTASAMRDFNHVLQREKATAGIFITLEKTTNRNAHAECAKAGKFKLGAEEFPRLQLWSVEEYFGQGRVNLILPTLADPKTGKARQQVMPLV